MTQAATQEPLPTASYLVLGLVGLGAASGYEIGQAVQASIRFFWTLSPAQIYPSLQRLEASGLIRGRSEPNGKRPRRAYRITDAGQLVLRDWLRAPEPMPFELRDLGMVKLFFADVLPVGEVHALVEALRGRSEERTETLAAIRPTAEASARAGDLLPLLTLELGLACHQAMAATCARFVAEHGSDGAPTEAAEGATTMA